MPQSAAAQAASVTWLRRTEYLGVEQRRQRAAEPKAPVEELDTSRDAQVARIEDGFKAANTPIGGLEHPQKCGVHAVDSYAVLPDPDTWSTHVQIVRFLDHPGRTQDDVRADTAILRPVTDGVSGQQRMSLYMTSADTLPQYGEDDGQEGPENTDVQKREDIASLRYQKRRRLGRFPRVPWLPDREGGEAAQDSNVYATPLRHVRDLEPTDQLSSASNQLLVVFDNGVPDPAPELEGISTNATVADNAAALEDDLFGGAPADADIDTTQPPAAATERARRLAPTVDGRKVVYYHRIDMRYALRLRRQRKAEQQLAVPYPDFWHRISLGNREPTENEQAKRLLERSQVDQLDLTGVEYESSDDGDGEHDSEHDAEGDENAEDTVADASDGPPVTKDVEAGKMDDADEQTGTDEQAGADEESGTGKHASAGEADHDMADAHANGADDDDGADGNADDADGTESEPDSATAADYDDELAALQAEAQDAGDTPVEGRRRR